MNRYSLRWENNLDEAGYRLTFRLYAFHGILRINLKSENSKTRAKWTLFRKERPIQFEPTEDKTADAGTGSKSQKQRKGIAYSMVGGARRIRTYFSAGDISRVLKLVMKHAWKRLKPSTVQVDIKYGASNPMYTGMIFGITRSIGLHDGIEGALQPDFLRERFDGWLEIIGEFRLGGLLWRGMHLFIYLILLVISRKMRIFISNNRTASNLYIALFY